MCKKLPFKKYTILNNDLIQNLSCSDVYRAYVLSLIADKEELTTDTTTNQLAEIIGESPANYKKGKGSPSFNDKLRSTGEVTLEPFIREEKSRIRYRFNPPTLFMYRRIDRAFYDNYNYLGPKTLGFILKLFSAAEPHSHLIKRSMRELESTIHMGHTTISKYITQLIALDLLGGKTVDGMLLKVTGLILDHPVTKETKEIMKMFDHMIEHNTANNKPLSRESMIYQKYKAKNFAGVKNLDAFMRKLQSGLIGRKKKKKEDDDVKIIL